MDCYHCNQPLVPVPEWKTYGQRMVLIHKKCERADLCNYALELGVVCGDPWEDYTEQQLIDAITCEKLCGEFMDRVDRLPTEEAQHDAIHRLRLSMEKDA